jgi:hypothetical protein
MILGHSAAAAACQSIDAGVAVQDVDYAKLRRVLDEQKQALTLPAGSVAGQVIDPRSLPGVVVDDSAATRTGDWSESSSSPGFIGEGYLHDGNVGQGAKSVTYELRAPAAGRYELRMSYTPNGNRATNVAVQIEAAGKAADATINQRQRPPIDGKFLSLGRWELPQGGVARVTISNRGADGHVIADAVQLLPAEAGKND